MTKGRRLGLQQTISLPDTRHQHDLLGLGHMPGPEDYLTCGLRSRADPNKAHGVIRFHGNLRPIDHPEYISYPGKFALVVDPIVRGFRLPQVPMNDSSGVNINFPDTLAKMAISRSRLQPLPTNFQFCIWQAGAPLGTARPRGRLRGRG